MITEKQEKNLYDLRCRVAAYMQEKRFRHTLAVEREVTRLADIYLPDNEYRLRCAALLHDITKELSVEKQLQLCDEFDIMYSDEKLLTPKIFHSETAPAVIKRDFPEYSDSDILDAVRWHTTGRENMTLGESLLFLADYIEDTRTFGSCIELRGYFYDRISDAHSMEQKLDVLYDTMILAFDMTIRELIGEGVPINSNTVAARNYYLCKKRS